MAAQQPQDRKTPKNQPKTVEAMGVTLAVSPAIFDDLDMVEYLYDLQTAQSGDGAGAFAIVPFLKKLCGPQYTAMKDALRDPDTGRVSIDKVSEFIAQLLEQVAPKLLTLIGMLATAPDALEADFQRFYGLNPDLIWTGELPANRAAALAANLPRQAIIWQKTQPAPRMGRPNLPSRRHPRQPRVPRLDENQGSLTQGARAGADNSNAPAPSGMKPRAARPWRWTTNN